MVGLQARETKEREREAKVEDGDTEAKQRLRGVTVCLQEEPEGGEDESELLFGLCGLRYAVRASDD